MDDASEKLAGGHASGAVLRVGATIRKPWTANTPTVHAYLTFLRAHGVDVPEPQGRDELGRQILEYVPGDNALVRGPLDLASLQRVGGLIRRIHDVSELFDVAGLDATSMLLPASDPDLMCHNDLAPWNLIVGEERWVFIDWDGAGPSTRLWDLAYSAQSFGGLVAGEPVESAAARLRAFVDGYGADAALRFELPNAMVARTAAMYELLERSHSDGFEPWATMYATGHGDFWRAASDYVATHVSAWESAVVR
jgi:hypothetical protein